MSIKPTENRAERVAELVREGYGWWRPCSGCHETNEGYPTGHFRYSHTFQCEAGSGCHECGGIGVVWQIAPTDAECRAMLTDASDDAPTDRVSMEPWPYTGVAPGTGGTRE